MLGSRLLLSTRSTPPRLVLGASSCQSHCLCSLHRRYLSSSADEKTWKLSVDPMRSLFVKHKKHQSSLLHEKGIVYAKAFDQIEACVNSFAKDDVLGVDTEFNSFPAYSEQLQLVQIGGQDSSACLDAQYLGNEMMKSAVNSIFSDKTIILHSYSVDLKLLRKAAGSSTWRPKELFDTQIAANLVGVGSSISLGNLIEVELGVHLDKSQSLSDWRLRPLTDAQLMYAMDDINYLIPLYESLSAKLREKGREEWMKEEMESILNENDQVVEDSDQWLRLRRLGQLNGADPASRCIAKRLTEWRENEARRRGVSPQIIVKDETLLSISKGKSSSLPVLQSLQAINWSLFYHNIESLQACIDQGIEDAKNGDVCQLPCEMELTPRENYMAEVVGTKLLGKIAEVCEEEGVALSALCPWEERRLLGLCAIGKYDATSLKLAKGWRSSLVGGEITRMLNLT
eukprot:m.31254 g.31254  ORF g.31254 m.31254 type:complete len:456 (-) comp6298_c3_seq1:264-1631(-)